MKAKKIVAAYYLISALTSGSMGFIMGVYSNFLRSGGLDEFWVNTVNVIYFMTITLCEIPTGLFADIFGRKNSIVISCLLEAVSCGVYGLSRGFGGFAIAETIGAVGRTFASGAFDAWLVDSLKANGEDHNIKKIFAKRSLISRMAVIATALAGGWLGDKGLNLPFFMSSLLFLITGLIVLLVMKEKNFVRQKFSLKAGLVEMKQTWQKSLTFAKKDLNFRFVLIISGVQTFAMMAPNMEWQKLFSNLGFSNSHNGIIAGVINITLMAGAVLSSRIDWLIKEEKNQMVWSQVLIGLCVILTATCHQIYPVVTFFLLHELCRGMADPIMDSYVQKCIVSPKERATLSSFGSMIKHFGGALGLLVSGLIAKLAGINAAWIVSGSLMIIASLWVAKNHAQKSK